MGGVRFIKVGGLTQGFGVRTFNVHHKSLKVKRPVSIKRPGLNSCKKSLLNVPYNLTNYFLNPLTSGTYNRNFRVRLEQEIFICVRY